jgi:hypothetical protein
MRVNWPIAQLMAFIAVTKDPDVKRYSNLVIENLWVKKPEFFHVSLEETLQQMIEQVVGIAEIWMNKQTKATKDTVPPMEPSKGKGKGKAGSEDDANVAVGASAGTKNGLDPADEPEPKRVKRDQEDRVRRPDSMRRELCLSSPWIRASRSIPPEKHLAATVVYFLPNDGWDYEGRQRRSDALIIGHSNPDRPVQRRAVKTV